MESVVCCTLRISRFWLPRCVRANYSTNQTATRPSELHVVSHKVEVEVEIDLNQF